MCTTACASHPRPSAGPRLRSDHRGARRAPMCVCAKRGHASVYSPRTCDRENTADSGRFRFCCAVGDAPGAHAHTTDLFMAREASFSVIRRAANPVTISPSRRQPGHDLPPVRSPPDSGRFRFCCAVGDAPGAHAHTTDLFMAREASFSVIRRAANPVTISPPPRQPGHDLPPPVRSPPGLTDTRPGLRSPAVRRPRGRTRTRPQATATRRWPRPAARTPGAQQGS